MELPELTDEELAIVEPPSFEDESEQEDVQAAPAESAEEEKVEEEKAEESEEPGEVDWHEEVEKLKRANAGLLNDLRRTRGDARADREWKQAVMERMELLAKRTEGQEEDPDPEPDKEEDAIAWLAWSQRQAVKQEVDPVKEQLSKQEEKEKYQEFVQNVRVESKAREENFLSETDIGEGEYNSRLDDLRLAIAKDFQAQGRSAQEAIMETQKQEQIFTVECLKNGLNPAQEAMRAWEELKPPRAPWREESKPQNAPVDAQADKKPSLSKVDAAKAGHGASGVGAMSGEGGASEITLEMLANMDDDNPIAKKIYDNEKKWYEINVLGKTTV